LSRRIDGGGIIQPWIGFPVQIVQDLPAKHPGRRSKDCLNSQFPRARKQRCSRNDGINFHNATSNPVPILRDWHLPRKRR
jgi:hypothetical protein